MQPLKGRTKAAFEIIEQMGEATPKEIFQLIEDKHRPKHFHALSSTLNSLWKQGRVLREKIPSSTPGQGARPTFKYRVNPNPEPPVIERKLKGPTEEGYKATIEELRSKVNELQDWKADAIKRFPDLAVTETLKKARTIVANRLRARGADEEANNVMAGRRDETAIVQAVVDTLEEVDG